MLDKVVARNPLFDVVEVRQHFQHRHGLTNQAFQAEVRQGPCPIPATRPLENLDESLNSRDTSVPHELHFAQPAELFSDKPLVYANLSVCSVDSCREGPRCNVEFCTQFLPSYIREAAFRRNEVAWIL